MIVAGTARSSKSYLINVIRYAISQTLPIGRPIEEVVPVLAYTGCAAHNVNGATIHGTLKLGFSSDSDDMTPAEVTDLQDRCQHMRVMIIDEKSMIGQAFLARIDRRLQLAFPDQGGYFLVGSMWYSWGISHNFHLLETLLCISNPLLSPACQVNAITKMLQDRGYFLYQRFNTFIQQCPWVGDGLGRSTAQVWADEKWCGQAREFIL